MMTNKTFIRRHPLLTYFALTFAISWGGVLPVTGSLLVAMLMHASLTASIEGPTNARKRVRMEREPVSRATACGRQSRYAVG
jgi:hypothetical protein